MPSETIPLSILPPLAECFYCTCYCEENAWKMCESVQKNFPNELSRAYAVFISNDERKVPLWMQKQSPSEEVPIVWDYHVIMVHQHPSSGSQVYDMDTSYTFPVDFEKYVTTAVGTNDRLMEEFYRFFRVIPAQEFLDTLASDRSHMKKEDGEYKSPPPSHPCIVAKDGTTMNLDSFIKMEKGTGHGEVMTLAEFTTKFMESSD
ncbi:protein N-terminal glutamine amidohydrolase [Strongylocentrotus purpuratus]|uniref:Protein N-terminal glutamine amidohydrolase n=1 Tax=Strongylocentrotus purpuratus TaxID=7668 RepID=A0A7M7REF2_STRPU|nr:protein N-terminal glutamine amidohydrolase [Strongylocentrotus purpuratus]|eukprot:XP_780924.4 PREDICTED: protein N-terminal glutamine amidohydrolase [Strongylocentrotus purpuratus]